MINRKPFDAIIIQIGDELLSMTQAAKLCPERPNVATLWRWRTTGCRGVKLQTVLVGGRRYTTREALQRFIEETTAAANGEAVPARSSKQRESAISAAERELDSFGV